jgi:hypothetical protein
LGGNTRFILDTFPSGLKRAREGIKTSRASPSYIITLPLASRPGQCIAFGANLHCPFSFAQGAASPGQNTHGKEEGRYTQSIVFSSFKKRRFAGI